MIASPRFIFFSKPVRSLLRDFNLQHSRKMTKTAVVLLAPGTEEMEMVISVDVLRRAGIDVTLASVTGRDVIKCSRGVHVVPDAALCDVKGKTFDAIVLPGGLGGSECFVKSDLVGKMMKAQEEAGRLVAAICAAPTALKAHKIGLGKQITSYPSLKGELSTDYKFIEQKVVVDGNLITSQGPGTAFDFGLAIVKYLLGEEKCLSVATGLLLQC